MVNYTDTKKIGGDSILLFLSFKSSEKPLWQVFLLETSLTTLEQESSWIAAWIETCLELQTSIAAFWNSCWLEIEVSLLAGDVSLAKASSWG